MHDSSPDMILVDLFMSLKFGKTGFTWFREKHVLVGVFWGYCTKYKCIVFIDLWFYLNKWLCVLSVTISHEFKWSEEFAWHMSSQETMSLVNWLSYRFPDKTVENHQNLSFHSLDTKFLPWVINSSLFLDRKLIQIISFTCWWSLHRL